MELLTATPRPSWMAPPPIEALIPRQRQRASVESVSCTLVSVGIGEPYESSLQHLSRTASPSGFNRTLLWTRKAFMSDPLSQKYSEELGALDAAARSKRKHPYRPFCAAFKPIALLRAMMESSDGDYVMWADSSKYHVNQTVGRANVHEAIARLRGLVPSRELLYRPGSRLLRRRAAAASSRWRATPWFQSYSSSGWPSRALGSAFGMLTCSPLDCENDLYTWNQRKSAVNLATIQGFLDLIPNATSFLKQPHVLNTNILLENTPQNRLFVWDWLAMALAKPRPFCNSHVQDQAAFSILVLNRSLPLINPCVYLHVGGQYEACVTHTKKIGTFLATIAGGTYESLLSRDYDWIRAGYGIK